MQEVLLALREFASKSKRQDGGTHKPECDVPLLYGSTLAAKPSSLSSWRTAGRSSDSPCTELHCYVPRTLGQLPVVATASKDSIATPPSLHRLHTAVSNLPVPSFSRCCRFFAASRSQFIIYTGVDLSTTVQKCRRRR